MRPLDLRELRQRRSRSDGILILPFDLLVVVHLDHFPRFALGTDDTHGLVAFKMRLYELIEFAPDACQKPHRDVYMITLAGHRAFLDDPGFGRGINAGNRQLPAVDVVEVFFQIRHFHVELLI